MFKRCDSLECCPNFDYGPKCLHGALLEPEGMISHDDGCHWTVNMCDQCMSSLTVHKMPKFALANSLYRGRLPSCFKDLTPVEEMACAIHRATAHISRLYGASSDESQPCKLHGNTCVHNLNVVSTVSVLPHTIADINDLISIVFIGPGKMKTKDLGHMFRIRKHMVIYFLKWLKAHNALYAQIDIDFTIVDDYPDDGPLPALDEHIIHDNETDGAALFESETAGPADHPAQVFANDDTHLDESYVFLEKMGVSDADEVLQGGRTFMASALRNLMEADPLKPDLIFHQSSQPVSDYHNPSLFPGMYPTLFPFGQGGFGEPSRAVKVPFQVQAGCFLDLCDCSFRYHDSFMFIALNIIQCHTAHLHTHFTVSRSHFDSVAKKLNSVSAETLASVAHH